MDAALKNNQLVRNGLVTSNTLTPILALPASLATKEAKRRRTVAANLVDKYEYESSGDEVDDFWTGRKSAPKVKFAKLEQALGRLEQPPAALKAATTGTKGARKGLKRKAAETETTTSGDSEEQQASKRSKLDDEKPTEAQLQTAWAAMPEDDSRPTLGFQKAMHDSGHPDFGLSFSAAVELAMAKEREASTLVATHDDWATEEDAGEDVEEDVVQPAVGDAAEAAVEAATEAAVGDTEIDLPGPPAVPESEPSSSPKQPKKAKRAKTAKQAKKSTAPVPQHRATSPPPQPSTSPLPPAAPLPPATSPPPLRITRTTVHLKYDRIAFGAARLLRERGFDFTDMQLVEGFNRELQELEPSRPYRSQKSLLEVSNMTSDEYYGTNGPSS